MGGGRSQARRRATGPGRRAWADLDPVKHGEVGLHFYTFGGFKTTAEWIADHRCALSA